MKETLTDSRVLCYHCGDECRETTLTFDSKTFCCDGCKLVYEILQENNLCTYYQFNDKPGVSPKQARDERFAYLDDAQVRQKLIQFCDDSQTSVTFYIPQMHCSSCIWLLEHLYRINQAVVRSRVNFLKREVSISFREKELSLRGLVEMLATIGYEPLIQLNDLEKERKVKLDRSMAYRIGVAGFAFGNIMLFSFPEYFSLSDYIEPGFKGIFSYINFGLSLPVFFYCSFPFFKAAWQSLHQRFLNIDVPIALGILIMFIRSLEEILTGIGPGYLDTMAGLVFFMLIGRAFQNKTYATLSFERDYKSFFPIAVMVRKNDKETSIPVSSLQVGDRMIVRNEELIPADSILLKGDASIDYSFVTGEAVPVTRRAGEWIYAGGKQQGAAIEVEVIKPVSQSYLTQLWNNDAYLSKHEDSGFQLLVNRISHYFTIFILAVALVSLGYWMMTGDFNRGWAAFTAVLIIACPCALAISSPFTLGNILRVFGRNKFYLKNYSVIEKLARVDTVVFDKTGTITQRDQAETGWEGTSLDDVQLQAIRSLVMQSAHPLSRQVYRFLPESNRLPVQEYREVPGSGLSGIVTGKSILLGAPSFCGLEAVKTEETESSVYCNIDGKVLGRFFIRNAYREGLEDVLNYLNKHNFRRLVLTGDHPGEAVRLRQLFGADAEIRFRQSPADKLNAIQALQQEGRNVLMIGDGLNDAGALKQSDVGVSITDDINNFSPACDGILDGSRFNRLGSILRTAKASRRIILGSFLIALAYNAVGLWFAVQGNLSPVIAAILMPISSVTIISFTTGMSNLAARK
ncbi:MAG: heavy metal translocating P-type ATPase [Bacteroidota bacterium]|jgi:Cu+-exporting ATPase